jgi:hypothetical protein
MKQITPGKLKKRIVSTTTIFLVALIIVVAANVMVWKNRLGKGTEIASLTAETNQVRQEISNIPAPAADLAPRLAEATANMTAAQVVFPSAFNLNDIIDYIIHLSRESHVEVLPITSQGWSTDASNPSRSVLTLTGTVTGSFTWTTDFIYRLQHGDYPALVVPELSFTNVSGPSGAAAFNGDNTTVTARMTIHIYASTVSGSKGATP